MNAFQNLSFASVEELLHYLPPQELQVVEPLRALIFNCLPDVTEKLAYNVPFYYGHSRICYLWPGAVPWGHTNEGVVLGFCKGHLMSDAAYLEAGNRKQVYTKTFFTPKEIDPLKIRELLYEAAWIDAEENKGKKKRR